MAKVVTNMKAMALFLFSTTKETDISNHDYVIGKLFFTPSSLWNFHFIIMSPLHFLLSELILKVWHSFDPSRWVLLCFLVLGGLCRSLDRVENFLQLSPLFILHRFRLKKWVPGAETDYVRNSPYFIKQRDGLKRDIAVLTLDTCQLWNVNFYPQHISL